MQQHISNLNRHSTTVHIISYALRQEGLKNYHMIMLNHHETTYLETLSMISIDVLMYKTHGCLSSARPGQGLRGPPRPPHDQPP